MTLARSVADVLSDHVTLEIESIDRMYLNLYVPKLQYESGVVGFFRNHLGYSFASSALMDPITKDFVKAIERFVDDEDVGRREALADSAEHPFDGRALVVGRQDHQDAHPLETTLRARARRLGRPAA